ncbi:MAG: hypothetical protein IJV34_03645 [Prevotella sp.]|nr:hypothetical protein [Prevotella sp.]
MIKKDYMKPTVKEVKILQAQMLCGSPTDVTTNGLDDDLGYDKNGGDQGGAWARRRKNWDDDSEEDAY